MTQHRPGARRRLFDRLGVGVLPILLFMAGCGDPTSVRDPVEELLSVITDRNQYLTYDDSIQIVLKNDSHMGFTIDNCGWSLDRKGEHFGWSPVVTPKEVRRCRDIVQTIRPNAVEVLFNAATGDIRTRSRTRLYPGIYRFTVRLTNSFSAQSDSITLHSEEFEFHGPWPWPSP